MAWSEFRIYLSSAVDDMSGEREHLHDEVFPELRAHCRERGIILTVVDLRRGIDRSDAATDALVPLCFEQIDHCRPYFIGLSGTSYGHVPESHDVWRRMPGIGRYHWLEGAVAGGMSIMEMEFRYGVLNPEWSSPVYDTRSRGRSGSALFYLRRRRLSDALDASTAGSLRLDRLHDQVRSAGLSVVEFRDNEMLGEMVYHDLMEIIRRDFADAAPPAPVERERFLHQAYARSFSGTFIANPVHLRRLNEFVAGDGLPLVVYAESGSGKSALIVHWIREYREANPDAFVVEHYIGAGEGDHHSIIRHLMLEINDRYKLDRTIPSSEEELEEEIASWINLVTEEPMVLVIDGANLLSDTVQGLRWLPDHIPSNIRLVITTTIEHSLVVMRDRGWQQMGLGPLPPTLRQALVARFLQEHELTLPLDIRATITDDPRSASPLFLRVVLEELRRLALHRFLRRRLSEYQAATGIDDLFQRLLEHVEEDFGEEPVALILSMLWGARTGLTVDELVEITGVCSLTVTMLHRSLNCYFIEREGRYFYFHEYLRKGVETRYLADDRAKLELHEQLATYFHREAQRQLRIQRQMMPPPGERGESLTSRLVVPERYLAELSFQRQQVELRRQLVQRLSVAELEESLLQEEDQRAQPLIEQRGEEAVEPVAEAVAGNDESVDSQEEVAQEAEAAELPTNGITDEPPPRPRPATGRRPSGRIFNDVRSVSDIDGLLEIAERLRNISGRFRPEHEEMGEEGDGPDEIALHDREAATGGQDTYPQALERFIQHLAGTPSEELIEKGGEESDESETTGYSSDTQRLIRCFTSDLLVSEEEGDKEGVAEAWCDLGIIHAMSGDSGRARDCFGAALAVAGEIDDRRLIALASGNLGVVCYSQGEYALAYEHLSRELHLARELGDDEAISVALGNLGIVHSDRSEYARALACWSEQLALDEVRGDREGMAIAIGNMGNVYRRKGDYRKVLGCFEQALDHARASGSGIATAHWLLRMAQTLIELVRASDPPPAYLADYVRLNDREVVLEEARDYVTECISRSSADTMREIAFEARMLLAVIDHSLGAFRAAEEQLLALLADAGDNDEQAAVHYELWRLGTFASSGAPTSRADHAAEAVRLYQSLYARAPRLEYGRRIVELKSLRRQSQVRQVE